MQTTWEPITKDIKIKTTGKTLRGVRGVSNKETGKVLFSIDDAIAAEIRGIAEEVGTRPRLLPFFWLMKAQIGPLQEGYICHKYRLNKMLFYLWKDAEKEHLGKAFPQDEFEAAKQGPVPVHLNDDLREIDKAGQVKVKWGDYYKGVSTEVWFTPTGEKIATEIWRQTPDDFKKLSIQVKQELFSLTPQSIMDKVHQEFPDYRKTFTEPDRE